MDLMNNYDYYFTINSRTLLAAAASPEWISLDNESTAIRVDHVVNIFD
jgi:hypothetical protein